MSEVNLNLQVDTQPVNLQVSTTQVAFTPNPNSLNVYTGGAPGPAGATGYTGSKGDPTGYTGSFGYTGSQGAQGPAGGYTGSQGNQGIPGAPGTPGANGPTGYTGSVGYTGSLGYTGSYGITGYWGSRGDTGYTGSAGYVGQDGYTGSIGYVGSRGSGYTGSQGAQGTGGVIANYFKAYSTSTATIRASTLPGTQIFPFENTVINNGFIVNTYTTGTQQYSLLTVLNSGTYNINLILNGDIFGYAGVYINNTVVDSPQYFGAGDEYTDSIFNLNANDVISFQTTGTYTSGGPPVTTSSYVIFEYPFDWNSNVFGTWQTIEFYVQQVTYTQQGYTGSASTAAGYVGSKGDIGYTGSASTIAGYIGSKGDTGYIGSQGIIGYIGSQGATGTGGVIANYFKAYSTLTQTVQKTAIPYEEYFPFETQIYNNGFTLNTYTTGTKQYSLLTVQNTGTYRINASFLNSNTSGQKAWALLINNSAIAYQGAAYANSSGYTMPIDTIVNLNPNDVISFTTTGTNVGTNSLISLVTNIGVLTNIPVLPSFIVDISQVTYTQQ